MAKVDDQLGRECLQLGEQKIHKICVAVEVHVYVAEKISTMKRWQFQLHLNRAR